MSRNGDAPGDPTRTTRLGTSDVRIGRVGLGLRGIGELPAASEAQAIATIRAALAAGIDLMDTAPVYGAGDSERRLRHSIGEVARDEVVIATKVGYLIGPPDPWRTYRRILREGLTNGGAGGAHLVRNVRKAAARIAGRIVPPGGRRTGSAPAIPDGPRLGAAVDFSYDAARRSLDESLERIGVDRIDLALIHDPQWHVPEALAGAYRALADAKAEGMVGAIGVAVNYVAPAMRFVIEVPLDALLIAGRYTLLDGSAGAELFPLAQRRGIPIIAAGAFNSGILADPSASPYFDYRPAGRRRIERALAIERMCRRHGVPLRAAALQFVAAHPAVAAVLIGVRSEDHLADDLAALATAIPTALWEDLRSHRVIAPDSPVPGVDEGQRNVA